MGEQDYELQSIKYTLDPARLPDGKKLSVKVVGASKRIALSSSSSAMWFPTLSGMLHSARSTASLNSESAASVQTIATDRSHYKGDLARRMASIPMPEPLPEAPLSARSIIGFAVVLFRLAHCIYRHAVLLEHPGDAIVRD